MESVGQEGLHIPRVLLDVDDSVSLLVRLGYGANYFASLSEDRMSLHIQNILVIKVQSVHLVLVRSYMVQTDLYILGTPEAILVLAEIDVIIWLPMRCRPL